MPRAFSQCARRCVRTLAGLVLAGASDAAAHGFVGQRFFPATITTEDPFVADELSLPTLTVLPDPDSEDEPLRRETDVAIDVDKRITTDLGIGISTTWTHLEGRGPGSSSTSGFGNLEVGAKYVLFSNAPHELLLSAGLDAEVGGTGKERVGADPFSTLAPAVLFGKGMGDLPDAVAWLRPFALTGTLGVAFPTDAKTSTGPGEFERNPHVFETGLALEYSVPYLQASVVDVGLRWPFNRLIPLVELSLETPLDRGEGGRTTGSVNPGILWVGTYFQVGVEAVVPVNDRTGHSVGAVAQLHFYLDDIFPRSIGKPLFGGL